MADDPGSPRVLVVDDGELNRQLLQDVLTQNGYHVDCADRGSEDLLRAIASEPPDVVLLDAMMPGIDGLTMCRRLKQDPASAHVPVLIITSNSDRAVRLKGIDAGANDFLLKPIDPHDMTLRVRNAARMKRMYDDAQKALARLRKLEDLRDNLTHMVVHDLRSPLFAIRLNLESFLRASRGVIDDDLRSDVKKAYNLSGPLLEMISSILDISRFEAGEMPVQKLSCDLSHLIREAVDQVRGAFDDKNVQIDASSVQVLCDPALIRRTVANLSANALKFSPRGGTVSVGIGSAGGSVEVWVKDQGPGIPPELHQRIFEKFGSIAHENSSKTYSTGLGLPFCKLAVEAHGGCIGVHSGTGDGSRFWFTLPAGTA